LTEWDEFKTYDSKKIKDEMKKPAFVFDGRKLLNRKQLEDLILNTTRLGNNLCKGKK